MFKNRTFNFYLWPWSGPRGTIHGLSLLSLHFLHLLYSICQSFTLALHHLGESSKILGIVVLQPYLAPFPLCFSLSPHAPILDFDFHRSKGFLCLICGVSFLLVTSRTVTQLIPLSLGCSCSFPNVLQSNNISFSEHAVKDIKMFAGIVIPPVCDRFQSLAPLYFFLTA